MKNKIIGINFYPGQAVHVHRENNQLDMYTKISMASRVRLCMIAEYLVKERKASITLFSRGGWGIDLEDACR